MLDATSKQKQTISMCVSVSRCFLVFWSCAGRSSTFVQVFDGEGDVAIENLNECWTRPARKTKTHREAETHTPSDGLFLLAGLVQYSFKFSMATGTLPSKFERLLDTTVQQKQTIGGWLQRRSNVSSELRADLV